MAMVKNNSETIRTEVLLKKLFTKRMNENELETYFKLMHFNNKDFHIHNSLLSEYVFNHYEEVNIDKSQSSDTYWQSNIQNLQAYLAKLIDLFKKVAKSQDVGKEIDKEKVIETARLLTDNEDLIMELAPKMEEHINLALLQYKTFLKKIDDMQMKTDKLSNEAKDLSIELNKKGQKLDNVTKKLNSATANFISILGIYSALIFGVFGGFDAFKSIFDNMKKTPVATILIDGSVLMIGLITLVFILLQSIGILSGKAYLACGHANSKECDCPFYKRYPIFSLTLKIFLGILVFGSVIHVANRAGFLYQTSRQVFLIVLGIIILLYLLCNIIKTTNYLDPRIIVSKFRHKD